ncbi:hypothetical protein MNBD_ALPHA03-1202, partial [hydrothermal vent metagenome]
GLKPSTILENVKASGYQGYMREDIYQVDKKAEPQRSETLRKIKAKVLHDLWSDISRYRECANQLRLYRQTNDTEYLGGICDDIHTAIGLKHNHIYNDMAHLNLLDNLMNKQKDLFDF